MKTIPAIVVLTVLCFGDASGQGLLHLANTPQTLISAGGGATPVRTSLDTTFYFGLFIAPSGTDVANGPNDPNWQSVNAYATNHTSVGSEGRIVPQNFVNTGYPANSTVDILVRGWSANLGTTWAEVASNPTLQVVGLVPGYYYGQSVVGQNISLGDGAVTPVFGVFGPNAFQVQGFNLVGIPEPSSLAIAGLGAFMLGCYRSRRR